VAGPPLGPAWTGRLGVVFLSCPILLACLTLWLRAERDRFTTLCVAALSCYS